MLACVSLFVAAAFSVEAAPAIDPRTRASELVRMGDKEFFGGFFYFLTEATQAKPPLPTSDLWLVLQRMETARTNETDQISHSLHMSYLVRLMARDGSRADFERLLELADKLPTEGWHRRYMMNALLDFAAKLEVEALPSERRIQVKVPALAPGFTPQIGAASSELTEAAHLFIAARSLHPPEPTNTWMSAQENWGFFYDTISQLMHGRLTNASEQMLRFKWGGWCGTGAPLFEMPQSRALFLALLKEHNYDAAIGALLRVGEEGFMSLPMLSGDAAWKRQFISRCALDWETLYAGEMASHSSWFNAGAARALARFGSAKGARLLADMAKVPAISDSRNYLLSLGALIGPTERISTTNATGSITFNTHWSQFEFVRPLSNAISSKLQFELLNILGDKLRQPNVSSEVAETTTKIFAELRRREAIPALRDALKLPYGRVRQTAASALSDFGEDAPKQTPLPPVAYRFRANGQPLTNAHVEFNLQMMGGRGVSSTPRTDSEGTIHIEHDYFIDPQYVVTNLSFTAARLKSLDQPWFKVESNVPTDLTRAATIDVKLRPLTLSFSTTFPIKRIAGATASLRLKRGKQASYGVVMEMISEDIVVPFSTKIVFSSLQPGLYQLEVRMAGAALWQSEQIRVSDKGADVSARLEPGADVMYRVNSPGGSPLFNRPAVEILRDGKLLPSYIFSDWRTNAFRSLPPGQYTLRVPSRAEQTRKSYGTNALIPAGYNYRGAELPFTISDNSPSIIDVGVIELQADK